MTVIINAPNRKVVVVSPDGNQVTLQPAISQRVVQIPSQKTIITNESNKVVQISERGPKVVVSRTGLQGPPGPAGSTDLTGIAGMNLSIYKAVVSIGGQLFHADPTNLAHFAAVVGITTQNALTGNPCNFLPLGEITGIPGLIADQIYSIGLGGSLQVSMFAGGALWGQSIGRAVNSSILFVDLQSPVIQ